MEEKKPRPFNLEEAKQGKPVCTRDGRPARILCTDMKGSYYPIVALVEDSDGKEYIQPYQLDGHYFSKEIEGLDLMMVPERHEGWINVYKGGKLDADYIYPTKADAVENIFHPMKDNYIDTIKVEWEEHP